MSDGSQSPTPLMNQTENFPYTAGTLHGIDFQAPRLPYGKQGRFSMLIVLPDPGADITKFAAGIAAAELNGLTAQLVSSSLSITLPRFTATYATSLLPGLTSMGMGIAFTPSADFSALLPGFWLNFVEHKTVIEVDERGTVAAAVTIGGNAGVAVPSVTIDHPFFYAIQGGKTGELLFIGVLLNPN